MHRFRWLGWWCVAMAVGVSAWADPPQIRFRKTQLDDKFRSEGVSVGDFNKDGKLDVAAGFVWYEAPDWKMHPLIQDPPTKDPKGYSNSFVNYTDDFNGDGWPDLLVVDFPGTPTWWFQNPGSAGGLWPKHLATPVTNNESPAYLDIDGSGRRSLICGVAPSTPTSDGPERRMAIVSPDKDPIKPWLIRTISTPAAPGTTKYSHGLGIGDVNKDGRNDVLCMDGWWEAHADKATAEWTFHKVPFGACAHMYVYDFDGDGDNDVLNSSPHAYGIWWHEQQPDGKWVKHEIDKSFSQTHAMMFADMNGDGLPDFITGKRWWAHAAGDPGVNEAAVFYWFELQRKDGKPTWIPHQFDHDSGPGTQFEVADINGDKLLDVIASNKKGVHVFHQVRE